MTGQAATTDSGPDSRLEDESGQPLTWAVMLLCDAWRPHCGGQRAFLPMYDRVLHGRSPECLEHVALRPGTLIRAGQLTHPAVSRKHATLLARDTHVVLEVQGKGPTFVNGKDIGAMALLKDGDIVRYGTWVTWRLVRCRRSMPAIDFFERDWWPEYGHPDPMTRFVGESRLMWALRSRLHQASRLVSADGRPEPILLVGGTGVGKDLCAEGVHRMSDRRAHPFVMRNMTTIVESLAELELFGRGKNVTNVNMPETGGMLGDAEGGTAFIDELGAVDPKIQAKLLQAIETGRYSRVGESRVRNADVRVIAATNAPDRILRDLYRRFSIKIEVPSLRERWEDIPLLVSHLLASAPQRTADVKHLFTVLPEIIEQLVVMELPENVRELRDELWARLERVTTHHETLKLDPERPITREELVAALQMAATQKEAAERLGITRDRVRGLMRKYGLKLPSGDREEP